MSFLFVIIWFSSQKLNSQKLSIILFMWMAFGSIVNQKDGILLCDAVPVSPTVSVPTDNVRSLEMALKRVVDLQRVDNLTRQHGGDMFNAYGKFGAFSCILISTDRQSVY